MNVESDRAQMTVPFKRAVQIYRVFGPFLKPYWLRIVVAYGGLLGMVSMTVLQPWPLKFIFDYILLGQPMPDTIDRVTAILGSDAFVLLTAICVAMVVIAVFHGLFEFVNRYYLSLVGQGIVSDIRESVFSHLHSLSQSSRTLRTSGDLVLLLTSDIKSFKELIISTAHKFTHFTFTFIMTIGVMLWMDWVSNSPPT